MAVYEITCYVFSETLNLYSLTHSLTRVFMPPFFAYRIMLAGRLSVRLCVCAFVCDAVVVKSVQRFDRFHQPCASTVVCLWTTIRFLGQKVQNHNQKITRYCKISLSEIALAISPTCVYVFSSSVLLCSCRST